jgi:hypothetical protein
MAEHEHIYTRIASNGDDPSRLLMLWCPGCDDAHQICIDGPQAWTWDGDRDQPTISPSILVTAVQWAPEYSFHRPNHRVAPGEKTVCHSFVRAGVWDFLGDSTHVLAGQQVPMAPWPSDSPVLEQGADHG